MKEEVFDDFDDLTEDTFETIDVLSEDGTNIECFVLDAISIDKIQYLLVVPCDEFDKDDVDAFILKQIEDDGNEVIYAPVENDAEYNKVLILLQENNGEYEMKF